MWTWWCTRSACWLAGRSHRIARRAKHPSAWRNAKSLGAHAAPAPYLLPHPFPQFVLSMCFHLPLSDPLQPRKRCCLATSLLLGGCGGIFQLLLQHKFISFWIFTSFSVKENNHFLILSGIESEWWKLPSHWWELLSYPCLNPCEWKLISIPIAPLRSCIRHTTFQPAWDLSHFLRLTLHRPPTQTFAILTLLPSLWSRETLTAVDLHLIGSPQILFSELFPLLHVQLIPRPQRWPP